MIGSSLKFLELNSCNFNEFNVGDIIEIKLVNATQSIISKRFVIVSKTIDYYRIPLIRLELDNGLRLCIDINKFVFMYNPKLSHGFFHKVVKVKKIY